MSVTVVTSTVYSVARCYAGLTMPVCSGLKGQMFWWWQRLRLHQDHHQGLCSGLFQLKRRPQIWVLSSSRLNITCCHCDVQIQIVLFLYDFNGPLISPGPLYICALKRQRRALSAVPISC